MQSQQAVLGYKLVELIRETRTCLRLYGLQLEETKQSFVIHSPMSHSIDVGTLEALPVTLRAYAAGMQVLGGRGFGNRIWLCAEHLEVYLDESREKVFSESWGI